MRQSNGLFSASSSSSTAPAPALSANKYHLLTDFLEQVLTQTDEKIAKLIGDADGDSPDDATRKLILRASLEIKYADDLSQSKAVNRGNKILAELD